MNISELYIHPLKSAAAKSVEELSYTRVGPAYDRQWMVVDDSGKFMSQRSEPIMCKITADIDIGTLVLSAPGMEILAVPKMSSARSVKVWGDDVLANDCGELAAQWLSEYLGKSCRLVELSEDTERAVDLDYANNGETVSFADGFPTLIVSQASLDEFNTHLDVPVDMRRFRPNIVIDGCLPYAEDAWEKIRINDIEFSLVKPCSRCIMPSINPDTAVKELNVNDVLLKTRRKDRKTFFGQNALHRGVGTVRVGDKVELIR